MNEAQIKAFLENPSINPLTQRRIVPGKAIHKSLMEMVRAHQVEHPQQLQQEATVKKAKKASKTKKAEAIAIPAKPRQKHTLVMVLGLGCSSMPPQNINKMRVSFAEYLRGTVDEVVLMCNTSYVSTVYDIAQTYCSFRPGLNNVFVKEVADVVTKHLDAGHRVTLLGHSYGGSVAARVAESFVKQLAGRSNAFATSPSLSIYTFGSIYIPKQARVEGIDIVHYMYVNDVALKCNGLSHKVPDPEKPVIWLRRSNFQTPVQKEFTFFGTHEEWDVHNDYNDVMMKCIRRKH